MWNVMLTLADKFCHTLYFHKLWGGALLVEKQQGFQKLFPAQSAFSPLPTQTDSALGPTQTQEKEVSWRMTAAPLTLHGVWDNACVQSNDIKTFWIYSKC